MNQYFIALEKLIQSNEFGSGDRLPPAAELARKLNAPLADIEDALSDLVYEGVLERDRPKPSEGLILPKRKLWGTLGGSHSITKEAKKRGEDPGVEILT